MHYPKENGLRWFHLFLNFCWKLIFPPPEIWSNYGQFCLVLFDKDFFLLIFRWFHLLFNFGWKSQLIWRLEHNIGLFCGYFDRTLLNFDLFGMVPKSSSCLTIFNCIWNNFLLFDPDSHFSIYGRFVSQTNIYLAVSKYLYGLRIKKLLYSCDICK